MTSLLRFRTNEINVRCMKTTVILCAILSSSYVLYFWIIQFPIPKIEPKVTKDSLLGIIRKDHLKQLHKEDPVFHIPTYQPFVSMPNISISCHFPEQDPFDPEVMRFFRRHAGIDCSNEIPDLVYLDGDYLRVNWTEAKRKGVVANHCEYEEYKLSPLRDSLLVSGTKIRFVNSTQLRRDIENVIVRCTWGLQHISTSYITRIVKKDHREKICEANYKRHIMRKSPLETLSVLLVGIDGTSRQNLIRAMPEVRNFLLKNMSAIEFYKVNKIGENTWPNMLGLVSGFHVEDLQKKGWRQNDHYDNFDDLFIWHDFKEAGYRTALIMDHHYMNPFHYLKVGWKTPPFDFYHRVMSLARAHAKVKNKECVGHTPEATFYLDYWLQLTTMFNNTKTSPYFALSFLTRVTHDYSTKATAADKLYLDFFQSLVTRNVLKNTIVIFYSDHGARFGAIRRVKHGMYETNTPLLFFMFPPWFHAKYPHLISALRTNQHRLTTLFDVHATLKDLIHFDGTTRKGSLESRGISLFKEIPRERMCQHADIPGMFCMCSTGTPLSIALRRRLSTTLLTHVNNKTANYRHLCDELHIFRKNYAFPITIDTDCKTCSYYRVAIQTSPGVLVTEGVLEHERTTDKIQVVQYQRLKRHGTVGTCLRDAELRKYCHCKKKTSRMKKHRQFY